MKPYQKKGNVKMKNLTPEYAQYLRELVYEAGCVDREHKVFGSSSHIYLLKPPLPDLLVSEYEKKNGIHLPSEYRFFITQVGNGGAGPDYGIYGLDLNKPCTINMAPPFITSHLTSSQWQQKLLPTEEDDCSNERYDSIEEDVMQGTYLLGTKGCTYENITITNGEEENRVFYIDFDWNGHSMPYDTQMDFLTWYEQFFREIIAGNDVSGYGYNVIASEQELIEEFQSAADPGRQRKLLSSFFRFPQISLQAKDFFLGLSDEKFPQQKLALLLRYETSQGVELFGHYLQERPEAAIAKSICVPKEAMPQFYKPLRHLLYTIENGSEQITGMVSSYHSALMRCMAECPQMCVWDILAFLKKDGLTERDQQDAFYYMGQAPDMQEHLEPFAAAMEQGPYWVAHAALQAVSHLRSEKLHPVLLKMWEKYHKDDCMRSNLKVAFKTNGIPIPSK